MSFLLSAPVLLLGVLTINGGQNERGCQMKYRREIVEAIYRYLNGGETVPTECIDELVSRLTSYNLCHQELKK